jgi:hypothetical protein
MRPPGRTRPDRGSETIDTGPFATIAASSGCGGGHAR